MGGLAGARRVHPGGRHLTAGCPRRCFPLLPVWHQTARTGGCKANGLQKAFCKPDVPVRGSNDFPGKAGSRRGGGFAGAMAATPKAAAPAGGSGGAAPGTLVCDGQPACVRGTFVRVSSEYVEWDVFKKFKGKVGMLTWRHFSGMWYADFPGEDEYGFLCGPLLFQLQYSSEREAHESAKELEKLRRERELQSALETEKSKQLVLALEKRAKEMSATTIRLFEQMAIIQEEMRKTEMDMGRMERAFTDLSAHANALDAELASTRAERDTLQSANSELQTQLHESQADVDRMAKRVKELVSENTEYKANLEHEKSERALLSRELQEETERAHTLDMANIDLKEQVKKLEGELGTAKAQLAIMEENFLVARQQAADASARADELGKTLKELEGKSLMVSCAFSPCPLCPQF